MVEKTTVTLPDPRSSLDSGDQAQARTATGTPVDTRPRASGIGHVRTDEGEYAPTTYSSYLFGRSGQNDRPLWSDSTKGRIAIRLVSRGIVGAAAFAWGSRFSGQQLKHYEPELFTFSWKGLREKPLQVLAKGFDATFGRTIQAGAKLMAPEGQKELWAKESTRFRSKAYYHGKDVGRDTGRSLGAEMVDVTFNFAMGSIGDATVRNLAQGLDPNNKKTWLVDKDGKPATHGKFLFGEWAKSVGGATWRILSKNQGEDWAAALPYVYQMKWQRQWIANHAPNFKLSADNGWNGASLLIDHHGNVTGDLQKAGAVDLHSRFVGYNWYTLMYRESYDMIGYQLKQWKDHHFKVALPDIGNPITAAVGAAGSGVRYIAKSFIKANIYMQPSVIPFWMMRVPQSKWRAGIIGNDMPNGVNAIAGTIPTDVDIANLAAKSGKSVNEIVRDMNEQFRKNGTLDKELCFQTTYKHAFVGEPGDKFLGKGTTPLSPTSEIAMAKSAYDNSLQKTTFSKVLNPLGKFSYYTGTKFTNGIERFAPSPIKNFFGATKQDRATFGRSMSDASLAYTPYMIMKAEMALRVDERPNGHELGEMDKAIYRFIDNTLTFNLKGMGQAIGDIGYHAVRTKEHISGREGGGATEAPIASTEPTIPTNRVVAKTVVAQAPMPHDTVHLNKATNDNEHSANDNEKSGERSWAESVTGRALDGRFQSAVPTLH